MLTSLHELRGVPEPWTFGRRDWLRSSEVDAVGHVNNTIYLAWFETVRVAYLDALEPSPYLDRQTIVKSLTAEYLLEMNINEAYVIAARTQSFRTTSFVQEYAVFAPNLRARGSAVIILIDRETGKKSPLPETIRQFFREHDGAENQRS